MVSGKDISFWYDSKNYEINKGTLGSSCMGKEECSFYNFFKIYEDNPDVCKLAIIKNGDKYIVIDLENEKIYEVDSDKGFTENELVKTWYSLIRNNKISLDSKVLADVPIGLSTNEPYFSISPLIIKEEFENSKITINGQLNTFYDKIKLHENVHVEISESALNNSEIVTTSESAKNSQLELTQEDIINLICG